MAVATISDDIFAASDDSEDIFAPKKPDDEDIFAAAHEPIQRDQTEDPTWAGIKGAVRGIGAAMPFVGQGIKSPVEEAPNPNSGDLGRGAPWLPKMVTDNIPNLTSVDKFAQPMAQMAGEYALGAGAGAAIGQLERQAKAKRLRDDKMPLNAWDYGTAALAGVIPGIADAPVSVAGKIAANVGMSVPFTVAAQRAENPDAPWSDLAKPESLKNMAINAAIPLGMGAVGQLAPHILPWMRPGHPEEITAPSPLPPDGTGEANAPVDAPTPSPQFEGVFPEYGQELPPLPNSPPKLWQTDAGVFARKPGEGVQDLTPLIRNAEQARSDFKRSQPIVGQVDTADMDLPVDAPIDPAKPLIPEEPQNRETINATPAEPTDNTLRNVGMEPAEPNADMDKTLPLRQGANPEAIQTAQTVEQNNEQPTNFAAQAALDAQQEGGDPNNESRSGNGQIEWQEGRQGGQVAPTPEPLRAGESLPPDSPLPQSNEDIFALEDTGIRNAVVDKQRQKYELDPRSIPAKEAFGDLWDSTLDKVAKDPEAGNRLVEDLKNKNRPLNSSEDALLTHEQLRRQQEFDSAIEAVNSDPENPENQSRLDSARNSIQDIYDVGQRAGTHNARGLNARRLMIKEDYSLARMEARTRAEENSGEPLTPDQTKRVGELHKRIKDLESQVGEQSAFDKILADMKAEREAAKANRTQATEFRAAQAEKAKQRVKNGGKIDASNPDLAIVGSRHMDIARGISKMASAADSFREKWNRGMMDEFGPEVEPHLDAIFEQSKQLHDEEEKTFGRTKKTPIEKIAAAAKSGKEPTRSNIYDLAREHINNGLNGREEVLDAVHSQLQETHPGITRRRVGEIFSEYGQTKFPSQEEDLAQLREMRRLEQIALATEDAEQDIPPKHTGYQRDMPSDEILKAQEELKAAMDKAGIKREPTQRDQLRTPQETYNRRYSNAIQKKIAEIQKRLNEGDYAPRPKGVKYELTPATERLQGQYEKAKLDFQRGLAKFKQSQRGMWEKFADGLVKWNRRFVLSAPSVIEKLTASAAYITATSPIEQGLTAVIGKALPWVSKKAARYGQFNPTVEAKAVTGMVKQFWNDFGTYAKEGATSLDNIYGKPALLPKEFFDLIGNIHGALKAPVRRNEFIRSFEYRTNSVSTHGIDVTDPAIQTQMMFAAYKDSNSAIFMDDNMITDAYKRAMSRFNQVNKATGKPSFRGKLASTAASLEFPIIKIPTNIVARTLEYTFGTVSGGARLARAIAKGMENLQPEEADLILRNLARGSLGLAGVLLGYLNPDNVGGYYQHGQKKDSNAPQYGGLKIGGIEIPRMLVHNPLLETLQIGATIRRLMDTKLKKSDKENQGLALATAKSLFGLIEQVPLARGAQDFGKMMDGQFMPVLGQHVQDVSPQAIQFLAKKLDTDALGNPIQRKPETFTDYLQAGFPILRQNVPIKKTKLPSFLQPTGTQ